MQGPDRVAAAAFVLALCATGARAAEPYPQMVPSAQYHLASVEAEVAMAKSAAPPSISGGAEVLVLGDKGYESAVKGKNGFVCIVERSWAVSFDDPEFWNPKIRSPICFNAASARSVLPEYLERTRWVLAGVDRAVMWTRRKAEVAAHAIPEPELGAMCYMMSKAGYLSDAAPAGHWRPHLMYFLPPTDPALWGANDAGGAPAAFPGSPMNAFRSTLEPVTVFFAAVPVWSDGTAADPMHM